MKNTTFRKKALLSSIAMLLVAFIALGSATFAWFTANPTVTATGLTATATTSAGLSVMSKSEKDWYTAAGKTAVWDNQTVIKTDLTNTTATTPEDAGTGAGEVFSTPLSYDFDAHGDASFYTVKAANENSYAMSSIAEAQPTASGFYKEDIFIKSTVPGQDAEAVSAKVSITGTADTMSATVRAMLYYNGDVIGAWSISGNDNAYITGGPTLVQPDPIDQEGRRDLYLASGTAVNGLSIPATASETDNYVSLYVWIDGEDQACATKNVSLDDILSSITVTLSSAPQ